MTASELIETDVVIVGAGPVGLFQVFELGLLDLKSHVVDTLVEAGGQCIELYPEKPIYDIPAVPVCTARELIARLQQQIAPFKPGMHLGQQVTACERRDDGRWRVATSAGTEFAARAVVIAGGVGSFLPRKLKIEGAERYEDRQLHYRVRDRELFRGKNIVLAGGGDSAFDWVLDLVDVAASVVMVHRSQDFKAQHAKVVQMRRLCDEYRMQFVEAEVSGFVGDDERFSAVRIAGRDGVTRTIEADHLLAFFGLSPKLGPIAEWGLALDKNQIEVDTAHFRSSVEGVYAVGDINTYPGKKKLILSGFHEAALAAFHIREVLNPGQKVYLQYTTTSPIMHKRLGVETDKEFQVERP